MSRVTSGARPRAEDEADVAVGPAPADGEAVRAASPADVVAGDAVPGDVLPGDAEVTVDQTEPAADEAEPAADRDVPDGDRDRRPRRLRRRRGRGGDEDAAPAARSRIRRGPAVPLVPVLAVLLVLLLGGVGFLWSTRPEHSGVQTGDYAQVLEAARSGVVDLTSFDYLTLDDDIARIKKVATGDLRTESVKQLDAKRKQLTDSQAIVNTEVIGAGVTHADDSTATVLLVIQSTQKSTASSQAQVLRYRIEAQLKKVGGRWLLSGITGR